MVSASRGIAGALDTTFLAAPTAPAQVRTLVELRLADWGLSRLRDDLTLIASELVTNALRWGGDQEIRVRLALEPRRVLLAVWDSSDDRPVSKRPLAASADDVTPDAEALDPGHDECAGGRGLPMVESLASSCGVTESKPSGKWVWAYVAF